MARIIFVLGNPGTGKSSSLRNLKKEDVSYITASGKELPFPTEFTPVTANTLKDIQGLVQKASKPIVVVDDLNFAMAYDVYHGEQSRKARNNPKETSWDTYRTLHDDFYGFIESIANKPGDQNVYLFGHIETDQNKVTLRTVGKAISTGATPPEGFTNIVLEAVVDPLEGFVFRTKTDGSGVKSPSFGDKPMFDGNIENDLQLVDKAIRNYFKPKKEAKK